MSSRSLEVFLGSISFAKKYDYVRGLTWWLGFGRGSLGQLTRRLRVSCLAPVDRGGHSRGVIRISYTRAPCLSHRWGARHLGYA
jgi:hypothetical protein